MLIWAARKQGCVCNLAYFVSSEYSKLLNTEPTSPLSVPTARCFESQFLLMHTIAP